MPKALPAALILEKNKVESENVWYLLLEVTLDQELLRFTNNNEDVVFNSQTYTAFPFSIGALESNNTGKVPSVELQVSNITKGIMTHVESANGLINSNVTLMVVNSGHLTEDYTELTLHFTIMATSVDQEWITFTLGAPNPMMRRFPQDKYVARYCNWVYKSVECGSTHPDISCNKTKTDCEAKGNLVHFGGYPGLAEDSLYVVR